MCAHLPSEEALLLSGNDHWLGRVYVPRCLPQFIERLENPLHGGPKEDMAEDAHDCLRGSI